ncbi:EF-hand domain-containing protein [Plasmodiophora brassicae]|nr:hypothetical protein PBRA_004222 [Plasmodiophora brassicae]
MDAERVVREIGHRPPRYDIHGSLLKDRPIDSVVATLHAPGNPAWESKPLHTSCRNLRHDRARADAPDPSFDVDGDGVVGTTDLLFATMFDADRDGRLNADEARRCQDALRAGLPDEITLLPPGGLHRMNEVDKANRNQGWIRTGTYETGSRTRAQMLAERRRVRRAEGAAVLAAMQSGNTPMHEPRPRYSETRLPLDLRSRLAKREAMRRETLRDIEAKTKSGWRQHAGANADSVLPTTGPVSASSATAPTRSTLLQHRRQAAKTTGNVWLEAGARKDAAARQRVYFGDRTDLFTDVISGRTIQPKAAWVDETPPAPQRAPLRKRRELAGTIGRMPAPDLAGAYSVRGPSVHQLAVLHGVDTAEMSMPADDADRDDGHLDSATLSAIARADLLPVYSSFSPDGIFREPRILETRKRPKSSRAVAPVSLFRQAMAERAQQRPSTAAPSVHIRQMPPSNQNMMEVLIAREKQNAGRVRCSTAGPIRSSGFLHARQHA